MLWISSTTGQSVMSSKCGDMEQALIDNAKAAYNSANIGRKNPKLQQRRKKGNMEEYTKDNIVKERYMEIDKEERGGG